MFALFNYTKFLQRLEKPKSFVDGKSPFIEFKV